MSEMVQTTFADFGIADQSPSSRGSDPVHEKEMEQEVDTRWDEGLDASTREFVQLKTDEIHGQLKRTAEGVIRIGQGLREVKKELGHGRYEGWLKAEFGMSLWTANKFVQVAMRFGDKSVNFTDLPLSVLYELAAPSTLEAVVDKVRSGEIEATLSSIKAAKEVEKRRADEAERGRAEVERQLQEVMAEVATLQRQLALTPQVVEKPMENPETQAELARLREKYAELEARLKIKTERVKQLSEEIDLHDQMNRQEKYNEQIRFKWRQACDAFHLGINQAITRMVTPLDAASAFVSDDWARLAEVEATLKHALEVLKGLRESVSSQFVEGSVEK
jgi:hypothetical protein